MLSVTSWFQVQLENNISEPVRKFSIGTSEYTDRVTKWPKIKRTINELKSLKVGIQLDNTDGHFNGFYANVYTIPNTCTLQVGFNHPTSGDELATLYTGFLENVRYGKRDICEVTLVDNLKDFEKRKIGESSNPVSFAAQIPSDIAWTLCTCYGGKSNIESTSNPDIDYTSFLAWASVLSANATECQAYYDGQKVIESLGDLAKITDSGIWVEGDGKINFLKYGEISSLDFTYTEEYFQNLEIEVEKQRLVNKAYVNFDYSVESDYFTKTVFAINSDSVNSYGLQEETYENKNIWHVSSVSALDFANRKIQLYFDPPRRFILDIDLYAMRQNLGETVKLEDTFYGVTIADGWRLSEQQFNLDNGQMVLELDSAIVATAFYLDVSSLDGEELLL